MIYSWTVQPVKGAMAEVTVAELTAQASDIIRGDVTAIESYWNESETFIFTGVTLKVAQIFKGELTIPSEITVEIPGGKVGDIGLGVEHAPHFETGQQVILFLSEQNDSTYHVTGWEKGKFTLEKETVKETGKTISSFQDEINQALK